MHNSDAIRILNCASDSPCFFTQGSGHYFSKIQNIKNIGNDISFPGDLDIQTEMSVRVQKGGFMVEALYH